MEYYLHDHFGAGRHAKLVGLARERKEGRASRRSEGSEPPLFGDDVVVNEVGEVDFPELLDPVDDEPPATVILTVRTLSGKLVVCGVSHDNGRIAAVEVNGEQATLEEGTPGVANWQIELGEGATELRAVAVDRAGNRELTAHRRVLR